MTQVTPFDMNKLDPRLRDDASVESREFSLPPEHHTTPRQSQAVGGPRQYQGPGQAFVGVSSPDVSSSSSPFPSSEQLPSPPALAQPGFDPNPSLASSSPSTTHPSTDFVPENPTTFFDSKPANLPLDLQWEQPQNWDFTQYQRLLKGCDGPGTLSSLKRRVKLLTSLLADDAPGCKKEEELMAKYPQTYVKMLAAAEGRLYVANGRREPILENSIGRCHGRWKAIALVGYVLQQCRRKDQRNRTATVKEGGIVQPKQKKVKVEHASSEEAVSQLAQVSAEKPSFEGSSEGVDKDQEQSHPPTAPTATGSSASQTPNPVRLGSFPRPAPVVPSQYFGAAYELKWGEQSTALLDAIYESLPHLSSEIEVILKATEKLDWHSDHPGPTSLARLTAAARHHVDHPLSAGPEEIGSQFGHSVFSHPDHTPGYQGFMGWVGESIIGGEDVWRFLIVLLDLLKVGVEHHHTLNSMDDRILSLTFGGEQDQIQRGDLESPDARR